MVAQQFQFLGERVVVGVHPGLRRFGRHELESERAHAAPAGHADRLHLRARHPQRRMRLLARLGDDVAQREVDVLAVVLPRVVPEHRQAAPDHVLPHLPLVAEADVERMELGRGGRLAEAELDPPVRHQVERGHPLGDACGVVGRELDDAVAEADLLRALAGRGEEHLRRRAVRVLLEEVVLDLPRVVVAEPVGELDLVEALLEQLVLAVGRPWPRQLVLVEDPELHGPKVDGRRWSPISGTGPRSEGRRGARPPTIPRERLGPSRFMVADSPLSHGVAPTVLDSARVAPANASR